MALFCLHQGHGLSFILIRLNPDAFLDAHGDVNYGVQIWVAEPTGREDLCTLVLAYLQGTVPHPPVDNAVNFYQAAKAAAVRVLLPPSVM